MDKLVHEPSEILAKRLRELRKKRGFTQSQLAQGICAQGLISNIENGSGKDNPSALTVYKLSERLGVTMSFLYGQSGETSQAPDFRSSKVGGIIESLKARRDYEALQYIIEVEKQNYHSYSNAEQQFLEWHDAIATYYLEKDLKEVINKFHHAINIQTEDTANNQIQTIEIYLSLGIIYLEEDQHTKSEETLLTCLDKIKGANKGEYSYKVLKKILFNLALVYTKLEDYKTSLAYCQEAIDLCTTYDCMTLLGDLLYHYGYNKYQLGDKSAAISCANKSLVIFEIQGNEKMKGIIIETINSMENDTII